MLCPAQINVALLHQLIDNSKSEHSRQINLRDKQAISSGVENLNALQAGKLKTTYQDLRKKFSAVGMGIETLQIGMEALPLLKQISADQSTIISLCLSKPALALLSIETQADLVDRAQLLLRYMYGLALSSGELGAMSRSDRAMLTDFVVSELRAISQVLSGLKRTLQALHALDVNNTRGLSDMFERDKQISRDILSKIKQLNNK
ncbi:hypothetical protein [Pedobacter jamesrossensis]|uniref:Toxic anion resistance protein (TelA) n=1 Tax=Pedobacter jamesrossensis TaxID=1908238 RepID=A0ABV8NPS4_9SPHI